MSQEEQAVLDFFSQAENLPLALSVGEHVDQLRQQLITAFWKELGTHLESRAGGWKIEFTEDRNRPANLAGLALRPPVAAAAFLSPMLEQQMTENHLRIYIGLMWNAAPAANLTALPEITALQQALQACGYKRNENFLGWRWSGIHPMRRDFLLRFSGSPSSAIQDGAALLDDFLVRHAALLDKANHALSRTPPSATITLNGLRQHH